LLGRAGRGRGERRRRHAAHGRHGLDRVRARARAAHDRGVPRSARRRAAPRPHRRPAVAGTRASRRQRRVRWLMGTGPGSWSGTRSLFARVVVVAMLLQPTLRATTVAPLLAVAMVALAWVDVALTYAVHHARLNTTGEVYRFPGEPPATLLDYVYMAVAVQTTFGTTDVQVMHPRGRRAVVSQGVLAFGFNTVIIGLVIALLVG